MSARFVGSKKAWVFFLFLVGGLVGLPAAFAQNGEMGTADLNHDSFVDANDLLEFHTQWQTGGANVPEDDPAQVAQCVITDVSLPADNKPLVTLNLVNGLGQPIHPSTLHRFRLIIARIVEDNLAQMRTHYENYLVRADGWPTYDSGGAVTDLGNGQYAYKFVKSVTINGPNLTHTLGIQLSYDQDGDGRRSVVNPLFHFRPDGGVVTTLRELSDTQSCNQCHNPLAIHGGTRTEFGLCILCHNPAAVGPPGTPAFEMDMANMVHQIHISQNWHNYHNASGTAGDGINSITAYPLFPGPVTYPQDIRNCHTCHTGSVDKAGEQANYYKQVPSRRACGSCHDKVDFATGAGHGAREGLTIPQGDDTQCSLCHPANHTQPLPAGEFDNSIPGAHTIPAKSTKLPKVVCKLLNVANATAGATPTITFSLATVVGGVTTTLTDLTGYSVTVTMAGPTSDYEFDKGQSITNANSVDNGDGTRSITPAALKVPADFAGTLAFAMSARSPNITVDTNASNPIPVPQTARAAAANPVVYVEVTKAVEPRRQVIDWNKCLKCHSVLALHGSNRNNYEYCVMCHRPASDDEARRNADDMPPVSVDFKYMIHKIHTGEELTKPYSVFGSRTAPATNEVEFNEVTFPGDRRDCESCHLPNTYSPPAVAGATDTVVTQGTGGVGVVLHLEPTQAACTACHDSDAALSHTQSLIDLNGGVENCAECHGPSREWAVNKVHHRGL